MMCRVHPLWVIGTGKHVQEVLLQRGECTVSLMFCCSRYAWDERVL